MRFLTATAGMRKQPENLKSSCAENQEVRFVFSEHLGWLFTETKEYSSTSFAFYAIELKKLIERLSFGVVYLYDVTYLHFMHLNLRNPVIQCLIH